MSEGGIFVFGSIIFFVTMFGAFLYGLASFREYSQREGYGRDDAE